MRISNLELFLYSLPLTERITLSGKTLHRRKGILVRLIGDDGAEGWGEASPLPGFSNESLQDADRELRGLEEVLVGQEITADLVFPDDAYNHKLDSLSLAPSARFGIELAVWNLLSAVSGETMSRRMVGSLWLSGLLSGSTDEILRDAYLMRDSGYRAAKLKIGRRSVEEDVDLVRAVSEVLGEQSSLRLDANRAWSLEEAERFARTAADMRFEYVEEPLADPALLPEFASKTGMPVALDESLVGMEPETLEGHDYARAVVLKPTLLGGIIRTMQMAEHARGLGIAPVISSAYETGVGALGLISLAASLSGEVPAGLDTYRRLAEDVLLPPLDLSFPRLDVREVLGVRRKLKWENLSLVGRF